MKRHVFITARSQPIPRWQEAFPNARLLCDQPTTQPDPALLSDASIIWLHVAEEGLTGADWVRQVRAMAEHVPIVVLSNVPEDEQGMAVLAAGATGYSSALTLPEVLRQVANVVEQGGLWVGPQLMRRFMQGLATRKPDSTVHALNQLSQRERQVAEAASRGSSNKEIARVMGITERTVKAHLGAAFEKLGVRDRMQLALLVNGVEDLTHLPQKIHA
ncbi:MAG: response regulator transcription factor [Thiobacillus sp.]|nr:response regulator transcription factor [Thiobacillus sp.]